MGGAIITPTDSSSLLALILSHENSTDQKFIEGLTRTSTDVLCCIPEPGAEDVLNATLDPAPHGLGYLIIVLSRLQSRRYPLASAMMDHVQRFCSRVRSACLVKVRSDLIGFINDVATFGSEKNMLPAAMDAIANLIKNFCPSEVLTCLHTEFMKISLMTRNTDRAVELSNIDILRIDQVYAPIEYQDHLKYHYFAGTVQALHQNYKRAIHLLTIAVSAPGPSISQIQIDAYKKLILISLLHNSKAPVLPRYVNNSFRSIFKSYQNGKIYNDFMTIYEGAEYGTQAHTKLHTIVQNNIAQFEKDRNVGLARLCLEALPRKTVLKYIPLYTALSLTHLTQLIRFGNDDATIELLESMIADGELSATIDPSRQVVSFHNQEALTLELGPQLENLIGRAKTLEREMRTIESRLETEPEFLKKVLKELKDSEKGDSGGSAVIGDKNPVPARQQNPFMQHEVEEDLGVGLTPSWEAPHTFS